MSLREVKRALLTGVSLVLLAGCANLTRIAGESEGIAWQARDMRFERRDVNGQSREGYAFNLVLRDLSGRGATISQIDYVLYQPATNSATRTVKGRWHLAPHGELSLPYWSFLSCRLPGECQERTQNIPLWDHHARHRRAGAADYLQSERSTSCRPVGAAC